MRQTARVEWQVIRSARPAVSTVASIAFFLDWWLACLCAALKPERRGERKLVDLLIGVKAVADDKRILTFFEGWPIWQGISVPAQVSERLSYVFLLLVSATSLLITLFSSRFVDPLTSLISLRVAQRNRMEFKPKLFASGVPTSWYPNVSGSRCLGVSVFRVVSRCTGVSGVLQRVFKLFSRYLHTGYYGSELFLHSLYG